MNTALSIAKILRFGRTTTARLGLSYLAIIMAMSVSFSFVFYRASARELDRPSGVEGVQTVRITSDGLWTADKTGAVMPVKEFLQERAAEGRRHLLTSLFFVNVLTLAGGSFLSYFLARRTLEPIESAMESQSRFTSDASHELRTPLAAIQAENEVALRNPKLTLPRAKELLASNLEEAVKLRTLAESLLQLSRADQQDLQLGPVALSSITTEAINRLIKAAQAKNISITDVVNKVQVLGDGYLLEEALVVLLDNAIKYSPADSTIFIESTITARHATLSVRDQGPGISATDQQHIFERFYRADQSRTKNQVAGYGLGLSIAQKIMDLQNGDITLRSTLGEGACFSLRLPLAQQAADTPTHSAKA